MDLFAKLENDMKASLKDGDTLKLSVLRMLVAAVKQLQIDKNLKAVQDADVMQILQRQVKQRKDSVDQFTKGGRADLAGKEEKELRILETYLPAQMGEEELTALVKASIAETGAAAKTDVGKVMKTVMEKAKGRCDGKTVNRIALSLLK